MAAAPIPPPPPGGVLAAGSKDYALILFIPVIFYCGAIQAALLFEGARIEERIVKLHIELDEGNAGWLLAAPGMPALVAISNDLRRQSAVQNVGSRFTEHREFANGQLSGWQPYENMKRGVIPDDALMAGGALGIRFYYLPDLKVIDIFGLTDATVARNRVTTPNHQRVIAHDRQPPPGYLEERGVNFTISPAAPSASTAFDRAGYAVKVGPELWMPFDSDRQWVFDHFAGRDLRVRDLFFDERILGRFEDGLDGWLLEGEAVTNHGQNEHYRDQQPISGSAGRGFLTSYHPDKGDRTTGRALSPAFTADSDQYLTFLIAGGMGSGVGLRLLAVGGEAAVWRGEGTERFRRVVYSLAEVAGQRLQLELFDDETGGWGHIMLDDVMLVRRQSEDQSEES